MLVRDALVAVVHALDALMLVRDALVVVRGAVVALDDAAVRRCLGCARVGCFGGGVRRLELEMTRFIFLVEVVSDLGAVQCTPPCWMVMLHGA